MTADSSAQFGIEDNTSPSDSDSHAEDNADTNDCISRAEDGDEPAAAAAADCCKVLFVAPCDARIALVPSGHQRFCASRAEVHTQGRGRPLCGSTIAMLLRMY